MSVQNEFSSFKLLLKQVYSAYSTKVKELENEVKCLREKLIEKEGKTNSILDCKRCVELEEAFKSCKKALNEQSKWFEDFGQKFSIFNSSELENQDLNDAKKTSSFVSEAIKSSRNFKNAIAFCDKEYILNKNETCIKNNGNNAEKISVAPSKQNILKKVILDDGGLESFDTYTETFNRNLKHENSTIKPDSMILVPDSLSTVLEGKKVDESSLKICNTGEKRKLSNFVANESCTDNKSDCQATKLSCKRLYPDSSNVNKHKKGSTGSLVESCPELIKTKDVKPSHTIVSRIVVKNEPSHISKNEDGKMKMMNGLSVKNVQISKKKNIIEEIALPLDIKNEIPRNSNNVNNSVNDVKNKNTLYQTSPSLLPTNVNAPPKIIEPEPASNDDNDDFQEQVPCSKSVANEDSWETCERKKSLRKNRIVKLIKGTSKFKMTLDAPPLNYKKPTYKQTKLSKSLFQNKNSDINKKTPEEPLLSENIPVVIIKDNSLPTILQDHFQTSTPNDAVKSPTVDIDATFIPENFKLESPQCSTTNVKKNTVEISHLKNGNLFSNISFPDELKSSARNDKNSHVNENDLEDHSPFQDAELKENMNSFDRLPLPKEPNYKYKNDVVRKKSERRRLNGFECKECEKYYSDLGLTDKEKKERMTKCSRHRGKYTPPATPDHFWELDFPDTVECKARGYLNETQKVKLNNISDI